MLESAFNGSLSYAALLTMAVYTVISGFIPICYFRWEWPPGAHKRTGERRITDGGDRGRACRGGAANLTTGWFATLDNAYRWLAG